MSSLRVLRPMARLAPRMTTQAAPRAPTGARRFLNTDTAPVLYSAYAKVVGAREGHVEGDDLQVDLTMAKVLGSGSTEGKTNPEELFAAGYGACFQSAMNAAAASVGVKMPTVKEDSVVETTVYLVGDMKKLDMGIRVDMTVKVKGLSKEDLEKVVAKGKEVCPYSRATQGNVTTNINIVQL